MYTHMVSYKNNKYLLGNVLGWLTYATQSVLHTPKYIYGTLLRICIGLHIFCPILNGQIYHVFE